MTRIWPRTPIYKLTARHQVPRCELEDLLFLKNREHLCRSLNIFDPFLLNQWCSNFFLSRTHLVTKKVKRSDGGPWYKYVQMGVPGTIMFKWGSLVKSILMSSYGIK